MARRMRAFSPPHRGNALDFFGLSCVFVLQDMLMHHVLFVFLYFCLLSLFLWFVFPSLLFFADHLSQIGYITVLNTHKLKDERVYSQSLLFE